MDAENAYDAVSYPAFPYPDTHPDRLAVMAALHGLSPAPVASCRVLEIGCSEGANLIPMAWGLPASQFTGFDLAGVPIRRGQARVEALGLRNLRLFQADLMTVNEAAPDPLGEFDYIVAHGLYSWIPAPARDRLLQLCAGHLAAGGVAFISYNALPGSALRQPIRDALLCGSKGAGAPAEHVEAGLQLLTALLATRPENDPYRRLLEEQMTKLRKRPAEVIFHDERAEVSEPQSFAEFMGHARRLGLDYLSESVLPNPNDPCFQPDLMRTVTDAVGDDIVAIEEMLDLARMRMYRETLLVRAGQTPRRSPRTEALIPMKFASAAASAPGERPGTRVYTLADGLKVGCSQRPAIAVMERLIAAWPRTVQYPELIAVAAEYGVPREDEARTLLLQMATARMLDLHLWEPQVADFVSERPRASAAIRQEAALRPHVATLWHGTVQLEDPRLRRLVQLLDGTRTRPELVAAMQSSFPELSSAELESGLDAHLPRFMRAALLQS